MRRNNIDEDIHMKFRILLFMASFASAALSAIAHDVQVETSAEPPVVIVKAAYAGQDPFSYAMITIYSPGDTQTEYQNGRTDERGVFAFVPHVAGPWTVVLDDEFGHRTEIIIPVAESFLQKGKKAGELSTDSYSTQNIPLFLKLLIGLSIIFGITGILYWIKARKLIGDK